jgi:delta-aminolevulinic acid dehydratase/porphobilinogen synthase
MNILSQFPQKRMRRLRKDDFSRRMVREHRLSADDFIYPVFVIEGNNRTEPVPSMPGVERMTLDRLLPVAEKCLKLGVPAMALFPLIDPALKTLDGKEATNADGLIPRVVTALKKNFPELGIMTDAALDPYTSHGQDGVSDDSGYIINDVTLAGAHSSSSGRGYCGSVGHDGRSHRRDPASAGRRQTYTHQDHGLFREIRLGLLWAISRRRRLGSQPR